MKKRTVGIVGLGLIGGSFAKAYKSDKEVDWTVLAYDLDRTTLGLAQIAGDVDDELTKERLPECELLLLALYPKATITYLEQMAPFMSKHTCVIDTCGTKGAICKRAFVIAREHGFSFIGGHPMAGRHFSGYKYSRATLFKGASMVLVPETTDDSSVPLIAQATMLLEPAQFGTVTISTAKQHDEMIAFTSQLAHVVSNAYIKSPTAKAHKGFSAGSYKDLTRVAWLNETMWTELFLENKGNLLNELDTIIGSLQEYRDALATEDANTLRQLLADGKHCKEEIDKRG